ncbi:MAG: lysine exporter LysO family protein [Firmicutes bacterium]|nr:lysine exporter LysO family protein [Bacillota bacterium]
MKLLLIYWAFLVAGYIAGSRLRAGDRIFTRLPSFMMITIYCLCFVMGLRMGVNEQVTSNLGKIGLEALAITFACIAGSMLAVFCTRKILRMDRYGDRIGAKAGGAADGTLPAGAPAVDAEERLEASAGEESGLDVRSTLILLSVVAAGMLIGALVLSKRGGQFLAWFDDKSNLTMVVLLCILMFMVGQDMGQAGNVVDNMKAAGIRILIFPIASMIGTMALGIGACLLLGFTMRESMAIPVGFGWYSYAPIVIASAGQQYIVASAVSFMHNVIREVAGIILIPVAAKKFGYLEAASIPGIAAMDVCMPIVGRACRADTMIYSFAIGLIMCVVTSIGVPLAMGV